MTLGKENDSDRLEYSLAPVERDIYEQMKLKPDQPFSYRDFIDKFSHGTIRNAFSKLKSLGLIKLWCRSPQAFYVLSSSKLAKPSSPVTVTHTVGKRGVREIRIDFGSFLDLLEWEDVCKVHNVVLAFPAEGLYEILQENNVGDLAEVSGDIHFGSFAWSKNRNVKMIVHKSDNTTVHVRCSECPIEVSVNGLVSMASFLGGVRVQLTNKATQLGSGFREEAIPQVCDWIVVQWHYGRDGAREISGPAFNVTFSTWSNELARIYMRHNGQLFKLRAEVVEKPNKSLPDAFAEKIDPNRENQTKHGPFK